MSGKNIFPANDMQSFLPKVSFLVYILCPLIKRFIKTGKTNLTASQDFRIALFTKKPIFFYTFATRNENSQKCVPSLDSGSLLSSAPCSITVCCPLMWLSNLEIRISFSSVLFFIASMRRNNAMTNIIDKQEQNEDNL